MSSFDLQCGAHWPLPNFRLVLGLRVRVRVRIRIGFRFHPNTNLKLGSARRSARHTARHQVKRTSGAKVIGTAEFSTAKLSSTVLSSGSPQYKRARGIRFNPLVAVWRGSAKEGIAAHSKLQRIPTGQGKNQNLRLNFMPCHTLTCAPLSSYISLPD
eukprot:sb/3473076/